jgi:hypothetical protein
MPATKPQELLTPVVAVVLVDIVVALVMAPLVVQES